MKTFPVLLVLHLENRIPITRDDTHLEKYCHDAVVGEAAEHTKGKQTQCVSNKAAGQERVW